MPVPSARTKSLPWKAISCAPPHRAAKATRRGPVELQIIEASDCVMAGRGPRARVRVGRAEVEGLVTEEIRLDANAGEHGEAAVKLVRDSGVAAAKCIPTCCWLSPARCIRQH